MLACLIAHRYRLKEKRPSRPGTERKVAPIHPQSLARAMGCAALDIANAFELHGVEARRKWTDIAEYLQHLGKDPNWRRSPSILDQLRGWKITPGRPKTARLASSTRNRAN